MMIHTTAPCSLLLGLARLPANKLAWLGITLQYPPIALDAFPALVPAAGAEAVLNVTGARADLAHAQALLLMQRLSLPPAEVEIEMGIPRYLGLGSEPMTGLAMARTLAVLGGSPLAEDTLGLANALELPPSDALAVHGFDHGGVLLVEAAPGAERWPSPLRRQAVAHDDEHAWVWVMHWPDTPPGTPASLEAERMAQLLAAAPHLSEDSGRLVVEELWPAMARDDLAAFGRALMAFQALNRAALAQAGTPAISAPGSDGVLRVLAENGAQAVGESAAGLARFGLIRGGPASVSLRRTVVQYVGYEGGTVMASIGDNQGAQHNIVTERM